MEDDDTNIIDFAKAKEDLILGTFDVDAWLAEAGSNRAGVEADFASLGVNEDDVPGLRRWKTFLTEVLETRPALPDHKMINESFKMERLARNSIILTKVECLVHHATGGPGSPSANGKAADRETGGPGRRLAQGFAPHPPW
jgi:hypothetical protein